MIGRMDFVAPDAIAKSPMVKKRVPEWMAHRNKVLQSFNAPTSTSAATATATAPSDESTLDASTDPKAQSPDRTYRSDETSPYVGDVYNSNHVKNNTGGDIGRSFTSGRSDNDEDYDDIQIRTKPLSTSLHGDHSNDDKDEIVIMSSDDGSSGWSTPDDAEITSRSSSQQQLRPESPHGNPRYHQEASPEAMISPSRRTEEMISQSNRSLGIPTNIMGHSYHSVDQTDDMISQESNHRGDDADPSQEIFTEESFRSTESEEFIVESYRTVETFVTVTDHEENDLIVEQPPVLAPEEAFQEAPSMPMPAAARQQQAPKPEVSTHSAASFWGNAIRFEDPLREKAQMESHEPRETSTQDAVTGEVDPQYREPPGNEPQFMFPRVAQELQFMFPRVAQRPILIPRGKENDDDSLPDPPAAMDGRSLLLHRNDNSQIGHDRHINVSSSKRMSNSKRPNPWMPPPSSGGATVDVDSNHNHGSTSSKDELLSNVTATIAETMKRLSAGDEDKDDYGDHQSSSHYQFVDTNHSTSHHSSVLPYDSGSEVLPRTGPVGMKRIDFAGQTTTIPYLDSTNKTNNKNKDLDVSNSSSRSNMSMKIRKYYDHGRNGNEDMRRLYMPAAIPVIENPRKEQEDLFDWVPRQYKAQPNSGSNPRVESSSQPGSIPSDNEHDGGVGTNYNSDANRSIYSSDANRSLYNSDANRSNNGSYDENSNRYDDGSEDINDGDDDGYDDDIEASRGSMPNGYDSKSESGHYYDDILKSAAAFSATSVDIDIVDSADQIEKENQTKDRSSVDGDITSVIHSETGVEENDEDRGRASATVDTTAASETEMNPVGVKPVSRCGLGVGICLIIVLVPGIIFGIRYYPEYSVWFRNLFGMNDDPS